MVGRTRPAIPPVERGTRFAWGAVLLLSVVGHQPPVTAAEAVPRPPKGFEARLRFFSNEANWERLPETATLDREMLTASVEAMRLYYLRHQRADGSFVYEYDLVRGELLGQDNQVRQAGALWALASLFRERPTVETQNAVVRGLDFSSGVPRLCRQGSPRRPTPGGRESRQAWWGWCALPSPISCVVPGVLARGVAKGFTRSGWRSIWSSCRRWNGETALGLRGTSSPMSRRRVSRTPTRTVNASWPTAGLRGTWGVKT